MKVGLIGLGHMGSAIYKSISAAFGADKIYASDHHQIKKEGLDPKPAFFSSDPREVIKQAEIVILAIKPQSFYEWNKSGMPVMKGKLVISVMAGVNSECLQKLTGAEEIIRVMPNLGIKVGCGLVGWHANNKVAEKQKKEWRTIFSTMGEEIEVKEEGLLDAITALSGSGPAYFYYLCELLAENARKLGFSEKEAMRLARATFIGSAEFLASGTVSVAEQRQAVTSKGGTTAAALEVLSQGEFARIFSQAVEAAYKRAQELSKNC